MASRRYKRKRRRGAGAFLSLITFCIVVGAIITSVIVFLKVAKIEVTGATRYAAADIIATSGIETGDNMFLINKFDVASEILKQYPYIESIKIRRRLPDTFVFEVTERVPAAYIESDGNRWLLDRNAYILEMLPEEQTVKVPKITGAEVVTPRAGAPLILENEDQLPVLKEVLGALQNTAMTEKTARIEIDKLYSISLIYENRFLVVLGDTSELSRKIEMLKAVVAELTELDKGTINVSAVREARFKPDDSIDLSEKPAEAESTNENQETSQSVSSEEEPQDAEKLVEQ